MKPRWTTLASIVHLSVICMVPCRGDKYGRRHSLKLVWLTQAIFSISEVMCVKFVVRTEVLPFEPSLPRSERSNRL